MGCTHYPALRVAIGKAAGNSVQLVDSAQGLIEDLTRLKLVEDGPAGKTKVLCTDFSPRLEETIRLLLNGIKVDSLETVDI